MRRLPQQYPNPHVRRRRDPRAARRQAILLVGCLLLACGFVYAVRQQILAVDYGYRTEALRHEREELLDEQRKLKLARAAQIEAAPREQRAEPGVFVGTASAGAAALRR